MKVRHGLNHAALIELLLTLRDKIALDVRIKLCEGALLHVVRVEVRRKFLTVSCASKCATHAYQRLRWGSTVCPRTLLARE